MKDLQMAFLATILLFSVSVMAQLPEDDEVLTGFPGYNHPIYSGIYQLIARVFGC